MYYLFKMYGYGGVSLIEGRVVIAHSIIINNGFLLICIGMQKFDREPQYTEANPGDAVIMQCRVFNMKGQCVWQKDGKV